MLNGHYNLPIGAYIGFPLRLTDGHLFGTLCAIHPEPVAETIHQEQDLLATMACLLATLLEAELQRSAQTRRIEQAEAEALSDDLTGLYNRRGWNRLLRQEEVRCQQLGHSATIFVIDMDDLKKTNDAIGHAAGDALLQKTAAILKHTLRDHDVVARTGGDEFAVLGIEVGNQDALLLQERLEQAMTSAQISCSVGYAVRHPSAGLEAAWLEADRTMYQQKASRKQAQNF